MESPFDDLGIILDRIAAGECAETDAAALRRFLVIGCEQNGLQLGKYNIRIGQGQDIQIGDRIYQGADAEAIQRVLAPIVLQLREDLTCLRQELLTRLQGYGLIEGVTALPLDLRRHFDRLLQDYDLFGGRVNELAAIQSFLAEPQGSYLFVTGPSGYGKTALLTQVTRLGDVAYHFLSRAYRTADEDLLLRNLCQQLSERHGIGGRLPASTAELRLLYPDLLRLPPVVNQPVVVLIDGLDEAQNWEPGLQHFPPDLPNGVKVVFSGRQMADRDWPDHLRLPIERVQRLVLGALTAHDLAALLRAAGGAVALLADDVAWIEEALQVSGGDPFYLKLLVEDLRSGRVQSKQVGQQPVGLDAYLKGWWDQVAVAVRAQDVRDLLGTLAIARGPLQRNELSAMFPDLGWVLDGVLAEVRRFVIGDQERGYALCHPRFASYVQKRVGLRASEAYLNTLLAHCAGWQEHPSPYILSHYVAHLCEGGHHDELFELVHSQNWYELRMSGEPSGSAYCAEIEQAWLTAEAIDGAAAAREQKAEFLGEETYCALITARTGRMASYLPRELLLALVDNGIWTVSEALASIRLQPGPSAREGDLEILLPHLASNPQLLSEALNIAGAIHREDRYASILPQMVPYLANDPRLLVQAVRIFCRIPYPVERVGFLAVLLPHLPPGLARTALAEAVQGLEAASSDYNWAFVNSLAGLAPHLAEHAELMQRLVQYACSVPSLSLRVASLTALVPHIRGDMGVKALEDVHSAARSVDRVDLRASALTALIPFATEEQKAGIIDEAKKAIASIEAEETRVEACRALREHTHRVQGPPDRKRALKVARAIADPATRARALTSVVLGLGGQQQKRVIDEALAAARFIEQATYRVEVLSELAASLGPEQGLPVIDEAFACTRLLRDAEERAEALIAMIPYMPPDRRRQVLSDAFAAACAIQESYSYRRALRALIPNLAGYPDLVEGALDAVCAIEPDIDRIGLLIVILPHLREDRRVSLVTEAIETIRGLANQSEYDVAEELTCLASYLPRERKVEALSDALKHARRASDYDYGTVDFVIRALVRLAVILPSDRRLTVMTQLFDSLPDYKRGLLAQLSLYLSERERSKVLEQWLFLVSDEQMRKQMNWILKCIQRTEEGRSTSANLAKVEIPSFAKLVAGLDVPNVTRLLNKASRLPPEQRSSLMAETLRAARSIDSDLLRAKALRAIAYLLEAEEKAAVLSEALDAAMTIGDDEDYGTALAELSHDLSGYPDLLIRALNQVSKVEMEWPGDRTYPLSSLTDRLADQPSSSVYPVWKDALHGVTARGWVDLVVSLGAMKYMIAALGGPEAVEDTCLAIPSAIRLLG